MSDEQRMILQMVAEGKITAEEGEKLLRQVAGSDRQQGLVSLDAVNLVKLGIEAIVQQMLEISQEPALRHRISQLQERFQNTVWETRSSRMSEPSNPRTKTERMKRALAELIQYAEELNASLDDALAGRCGDE